MSAELGRALVTGAAQGIGRAIAVRLATDGYEVVLADIKPLVRETAQTIRAAGGRARGEVIDIRDRAAVAALVAEVSPLAVLVNNAAVFTDKTFEALTEDDFRTMYGVNLVAAAILAQEAAKRMEAGGRIVNLGSRSLLGARNHAHYIASKAAVAGLTRSMAIDLAARGIRVNCVSPGVIRTELFDRLAPERQEDMLRAQPTGRIGEPEDIARAVSFFAAPDNHYLTGQILHVDGGKSLGQERPLVP